MYPNVEAELLKTSFFDLFKETESVFCGYGKDEDDKTPGMTGNPSRVLVVYQDYIDK